MHRCDVRKAFRRLKQKCGVCEHLPGFPDKHSHTPHTYEVISVGGVLLSHNPTIAVPSAQSNLATGIGTGPGVPLTLKPPTQTHETTTTPHTPSTGVQASVLCQTLYNKHKHNNNHILYFRGNLAPSNTIFFCCPHTLGVFFVSVY